MSLHFKCVFDMLALPPYILLLYEDVVRKNFFVVRKSGSSSKMKPQFKHKKLNIFFMHSTFHKTRKLNFGRNLTIDEIMDACDLFKTCVSGIQYMII